jgi:hypothetical protein
MQYTIEKKDYEEIQRIRTLSRAQPSDITSIRNLYEKYVNIRLKKLVDWNCPTCLRLVRDELINFQSGAKIIDENESKVNPIEQPSKSGKRDK